MMRLLIVKQPWTDQIMAGLKTIEYRTRRTHIRGRIGIVAAGTGMIIGEIDLIGCEEPVIETINWPLANPTCYGAPKHYRHPPDAQT